MNNISDRLIQYLDYKNISKNRFYKELGLSVGYLTRKPEISAKIIKDIINTYTDINLYWLITSKGSMLRTPGEELECNIVNEPQAVYKTARDIETENTLLKQENKFLNKEIEYLKNEISLKDKIIKLLENK